MLRVAFLVTSLIPSYNRAQPTVLIVRFMLNLRGLSEYEGSTDGKTMNNISDLFSGLAFRVPTAFLGNIGEDLDHGQVECYTYGGVEDHKSWVDVPCN